MKEFKDRVAVVTGAASGIGNAMTETFIDAGMKVVLSDVDEESLDRNVKRLREKGATVIGVTADVSKADQVVTLADKTVQAFGIPHVLCNNAGVTCNRANSWDIPLSGWQWVLGVNLMGAVHGIQSFLPMMLEQQIDGHIVNTASLFGLVNNFLNTPYCVSKHAVVALSENLHKELQAKNAKVKVSVLCPGPVSTDIEHSVERIRPENVPPPPEISQEQEVLVKAIRLWIKRGLDPLVVGKQVLEAIRNEQFYIITHQDADPEIRQRMQGILDRQNPVLSPPPEEILSIIEEIMRAGDKPST